VPGGNLGNSSAIGKGLIELKQLGFIDKFPKLVVIQAEGASPFYQMLLNGASDITPVTQPSTEATAIRIGDPVNWKKALRALSVTHGFCDAVSDDQIFEAKAALAKDGVGCEPASAATIAGIKKLIASGAIPPGADVVAVLTGHQLKDPESGLRRHTEAELARQRKHVEADVKKLRAALEDVLMQTA
jgi:threonine synthase